MALAFLRRRWKPATTVLAAAALGAFGFKHSQKAKQGPPQGTAAEAASAAAERGDLQTVFQEIGDIAAKNSVNVASKVSGRIIELTVGEGDRVKAGQKLAVIQPGKTETERFLPSTVSSPIDGVVLAYLKNPEATNQSVRFVEVNDYVTGTFDSQNPTYLMTVADMRKVVVKLRINEMDILKLQEKLPVKVNVDSIPDTEFPATVTMVSPQAEKESRGGKIFRVEVTLDKTDPRLRTGMTARVEAVLEKRQNVLKVPLSGLFEESGRASVYLDVPGGKPRQTEVKTGLRTELETEILSGLNEGDKILTEKPVDCVSLPPVKGAAQKGPSRRSSRKAAQMSSSITIRM